MLALSDIHANLPALEAVLDHAPPEPVLFCGDLIGYYVWPNEVAEVARDRSFRGVRGNHDEALVSGSTFGFRGEAARMIRWTEEEISDENRAFIEDLPYSRREEVDGADVLMVHGSPSAPVEEYVYPDRVDSAFLDRQGVDADVLLMGHTHVPFAKTVDDTLVVNPGSVGQPRDGDPRAAYATLDPAAGEAEIHRVDYDRERVAEEMRARDLPERLAERLAEGR